MSVFDQFAKVQAAQLRMSAARQELSTPAAALLARGHTHPLATVGAAAGAGFVLGSLKVHPLRVPGMGPLLGGGLADAVAFGTRLIAELGAAGLAGAGRDTRAPDAEDDERS
ncbi:hypothetical protein RHOFW510R12_33945 [Rhodanobacter sp. FW510-R12]|uniref:hypothetical protein n=1 Tax=unclassified Rhodanobacter TaxID=2621553 RepID=UPI0007A9A89A|nr:MULTISPECIES: hypothetical protein [unclassified Rhodanobacter]KZC16658.1 hypothetical protein RHOFW104R8_15310 [Rhodanobacter sp. FW104-R8]KZC27481.1 hypothetical protein RhoFW510T8_15225 [Rhodanobacter sp. FW510-T8]KZC31878.1 hypothetical protein RhoFW510R10_15165 [Rhodanobacter sp. FW510-R10]